MNVTSPKDIARLLQDNGLSPLKKFGQNFLCDANIVEKIAAYLPEGAPVLEVGTGLGALTRKLAERAEKVVSVEIDRGLLALHAQTLGDLANVSVTEGDILEVDLEQIWKDKFDCKSFHVFGNLPYYITSKIILRFLECGLPVRSMVCMVQKEVAQRLAAKPGDSDYGALSASCNYYCEPEYLFTVPKGCFLPAPDVDSAMIRLDLSRPRCDVRREDYVRVVRAAFSMRRKTIQNNLKGIAQPDALQRCSIDPKRRAQELSPDEFCMLARVIFPENEKA